MIWEGLKILQRCIQQQQFETLAMQEQDLEKECIRQFEDEVDVLRSQIELLKLKMEESIKRNEEEFTGLDLNSPMPMEE